MTAMPVVVVAAVIERDGTVLATRRLPGSHLAGYWEFPGGKCEPGEDHFDCLRREIREELGVGVEIGAKLLSTRFDYPDKAVELHFYRCELVGEPQPLLGQPIRWVRAEELATLPFPEADKALIERLRPHEGRPGHDR